MAAKGVQANIRISDTARPKMIKVSGSSMRNRPLPRNPGSSATTPTTAAPIPCSPTPAPIPARPVARPAPTAISPYSIPASVITCIAIFLNPPFLLPLNFQIPPDVSEGRIFNSTTMRTVEFCEHLHIMQPQGVHEWRQNSEQQIDEVHYN